MLMITPAEAFKVINTLAMSNNGIREFPSQKNGILQLLLSSANKKAAKFKLGDIKMPEDGKFYVVNRTVNPRMNPSGGNATMQYCPTTGTEIRPKSDVIQINRQTVSDPIKISNELMRCIQQAKPEYVAALLKDYVRVHLNVLAIQVATEAATKAGNFYRNDCLDPIITCKNLPLFFNTTGFGVNPVANAILRRDAKEADLMDDLILVGGSHLLEDYTLARQLASGNQLGFNASLSDITRSTYFDPNLSQALGNPNQILAIAPGALQLVTANKHAGFFADSSDLQQRETYIDEFYGIEHDILIYKDTCGSEVAMFMQLSTLWTLVGVPECRDEDCRFDGVKDVFCYTAVCADTSYCDLAPTYGTSDNATPFNGFCTAADTCETFPIDILAFNDANNNDLHDIGELGVAEIIVRVYADNLGANLVATAATAATGLAAFNLPSGTYYVDVDYASVLTAGHIINVTVLLPWVLIVTDAGTALYPGWFEAGKIPLGTAVIV